MYKTLIIGHGVVGRNLAAEIGKLNPDIYDIKYGADKIRRSCYDGEYTMGVLTYPYDHPHYDIAFVCIDTPKMDTIEAPIDDLVNVISAHDAFVFVIKSTILPGSVERLKALTGKRIVFSPEYYGGTQHCNNFDFPFTILGGDKADCVYVQKVLQHVYDARHSFRIVTAETAELAKYMENAWLATKVSFCNQFYFLANKAGVDYEDLRELFILDPRVNPSHTFVYDEHPYWSSHCLNKDVPTIAAWGDAELLKAVIEFNEHCKQGSK